jgi:tetratricopeptide (TPR) repeat protein
MGKIKSKRLWILITSLRQKKVFLYAGLIPVVIFLFFLPSLFNSFVNWDDPDVILGNPLLKDFSWQGIQTILVTMWTGQYHRFIPLSMVFFAAEYHFFGANPFGYHFFSVLLHSINSLGVFVLIYFLTSSVNAAVLAALLFGLHPLAVQPVVWIAAETYPIGTFFFLSSVILYTIRSEALAFITFFLALLFYSQLALPLPFILLAIDYYLQGKIGWGDVFRKTPFFLLTFYFGWLTLKAAQHLAADYVPFFLVHHLSLFNRINLSSEAFWMYLQKFFIPHPLACYYPIIYYFHGPLFLYSVTAAGLFFFFALFRRQAGLRVSYLGLLWFVLTIAPFLHLYGVSESIINDRYFYIPSIGVLLMLIGVLGSLRLGKIAAGAGLLWSILIVFLSYQQIGVWRDSGKLWTDFISQYPKFSDGYINRSDYYLKMKKPRLALRDLYILLKFDPQNAAAYQNMGHAFLQLRQWQAEIDAYTRVIALNPGFVQIYVDRGAAFFILGKDDLALADFNRALKKDPREENALFNRGIVYCYDKEFRRSLEDFQKVVLIDPNNIQAKNKILELRHVQRPSKF